MTKRKNIVQILMFPSNSIVFRPISLFVKNLRFLTLSFAEKSNFIFELVK